jgi:hypothetical protein
MTIERGRERRQEGLARAGRQVHSYGALTKQAGDRGAGGSDALVALVPAVPSPIVGVGLPGLLIACEASTSQAA